MAIVSVVCVAALLGAIPRQSHVLLVDLPIPFEEGEALHTARPIIRIGVSPDGSALWNGEAVARAEMLDLANAAMAQPRLPLVVFQPDPQSSYGDSLEVLREVWRTGLIRAHFCFGGIRAHRWFGKGNDREHGGGGSFQLLLSIASEEPSEPPMSWPRHSMQPATFTDWRECELADQNEP